MVQALQMLGADAQRQGIGDRFSQGQRGLIDLIQTLAIHLSKNGSARKCAISSWFGQGSGTGFGDKGSWTRRLPFSSWAWWSQSSTLMLCGDGCAHVSVAHVVANVALRKDDDRDD